eukprot:m.78274 g.78274  ORF g.78274 m.78274 type:complete len:374 (-) comp7959_c0_seq3:92-1213(-)
MSVLGRKALLSALLAMFLMLNTYYLLGSRSRPPAEKTAPFVEPLESDIQSVVGDRRITPQPQLSSVGGMASQGNPRPAIGSHASGHNAGGPVLTTPAPRQPGTHRLAVLVPYREAEWELRQFVPNITQYLQAQGIDFTLFAIEQNDTYPFNRGALLNIGALQACDTHDYLALHDVDLLPSHPNISYRFPARGPVHLTPPAMHPKYHFRKFVGGIMLITCRTFTGLNGFASDFFGWGREDFNFGYRMRCQNITLRPVEMSPPVWLWRDGTQNYWQHLHNPEVRPRTMVRHPGKMNAYDRATGLNTTVFKVLQVKTQDIQGAPYTRVTIKLSCKIKACAGVVYRRPERRGKWAKRRPTEAAPTTKKKNSHTGKAA